MEASQASQPPAAGEQGNPITDTYLFHALFVTTNIIWGKAWSVISIPIHSIDFLVFLPVSLYVVWAIDFLFFYGVQMLRPPQNPSKKSWLTKGIADEDMSTLLELLVLIVTTNFIWVSAWVLANHINSNPDFAPLVPVSVVVAWAIDVLFFSCVLFQLLWSSQNNNQNLQLEQPRKPSPTGQVQNPRKKSWLSKDLADVIILFVGLGIQQHLVSSFDSFLIWISCLARVIICFLILKHPKDYGFIDLFITLLTQGAFYFNKEKRIILLLLTLIFCVGLVILRNLLIRRRGLFSRR